MRSKSVYGMRAYPRKCCGYWVAGPSIQHSVQHGATSLQHSDEIIACFALRTKKELMERAMD